MLAGQILDGKYRIERLLGRGGMGAVFRAVHLGTLRPVAVKVISERFVDNPEYIERFRREAEAVGRLRHPNVVDVTDFGFAVTQSGRIAYLVMEYLDGCTLDEVLREEKRLSLKWAVDVMEQVCSAVGEAHRVGIVHRDIKPENIWLEPNERGGYTAKVLDFGIARLEPASAGRNSGAPASSVFDDRNPETPARIGELTGVMARPAEPTEQLFASASRQTPTGSPNATVVYADASREPTVYDVRPTADVTRVGALMGTPSYMSPEQCRGERPSHLGDIYSLGVVAYQMLSGVTPFTGEPVAIIRGHLDKKPPRMKGWRTPRRVKKVVRSALAKDPIDRPESAAVFAAQLRSYSEGIISIFRRSLVILVENFSRLLLFGLLLYLPTILIAAAVFGLNMLEFREAIVPPVSSVLQAALKFVNICVTSAVETVVYGAVAWIVIQYISTPLRPFRIAGAFGAVFREWRQFAWIIPVRAAMSYLIQGDIFSFSFGPMAALSYLDSILFWALPCVVVLEHQKGLRAVTRGWRLTLKALWTVFAATLLRDLIYLAVQLTALVLLFFLVQNTLPRLFPEAGLTDAFVLRSAEGLGLIIVKVAGTFLLPLFAVVNTLVYLKTRYAGGESTRDLIEQFKLTNVPQTGWQRKIGERLSAGGRVVGTP